MNNVFAALIFFTRLPFWRLHQPPKEAYATVVEHWPLAGWLTGGTMAATLYVGSLVLPYPLAVLAAIAVRILLTGALHEDGLADFCDGMGGGRDRQHTLAIMKDSHIGTFGVLGLVLYLLTLFTSLRHMQPTVAALTILAADPLAKMLTAPMTTLMPYARLEAEAKAKIVYRRMGVRALLGVLVQGLLPALPLLLLTDICWWPALSAATATATALCAFTWNKLKGYTGDCCGAICLLVELSAYITMSAII